MDKKLHENLRIKFNRMIIVIVRRKDAKLFCSIYNYIIVRMDFKVENSSFLLRTMS